jgi:hypothetical protein
VPPADAPNEEKARLVVGFCQRFNERFIQPKRLGFNKADPMFGFVGRALCRIEPELHDTIVGKKLYCFNADSIHAPL